MNLARTGQPIKIVRIEERKVFHNYRANEVEKRQLAKFKEIAPPIIHLSNPEFVKYADQSTHILDSSLLFHSCFPPEERPSPYMCCYSLYSSLTRSYGSKPENEFLLFAAVKENIEHYHDVLGALCASYLSDVCGFLSYLAVDEMQRRQGIGRMLVNAALNSFWQLGAPLVVGEIEYPEINYGYNAAGERWKRLRFFAKLGFKKVDGIDYCLPGNNGPLPMMLMVRTMDQDTSSLSAEQTVNLANTAFSDLGTYQFIGNEIKGQCMRRLERSCAGREELTLSPLCQV
jgi:GNAT superfamily N-acetyltransferase